MDNTISLPVGKADNVAELVKSPEDEKALWLNEIKLYQKEFDHWEKKCDEIAPRYLNSKAIEVAAGADPSPSKSFAILYSNIQTLLPAIFSALPVVEIERRHKDKDVQARLSSEVLERATDYQLHCYDFENVANCGVLDYLLYARGQARIIYEPTIIEDQIVDEKVVIKYVHRKDFAHSCDRVWEETRWVAFRSFMSREELMKRWPDKGQAIKLEYTPSSVKNTTTEEGKLDFYKKAEVWEIWDKPSKTVKWVTNGYPEVLEVKPDPYTLHGFFPCPKPLYGTVANESLKPTPDYLFYEDQAKELNVITKRISLLISACRVAGVYDASAKEVDRLLSENVENSLVPVMNWSALIREGGIEGLVSWLPIEQIASVLVHLYTARDRVLQEIYEITGISDILRGNSNPAETATAQNIKGQFATLRVNTRQKAVQKWLRDLIALSAEFIAEHFQPETILKTGGYEFMLDANLQDETEAQGIIQLLRDDPSRNYRIDIETDSTIAINEQADKQAVNEYLTSVGGFMNQALPVMQNAPALAPMLKEMLLLTARKYRIGRTLESVIDGSFDGLIQQLQNPPPPEPDPKIVADQNRLQFEQSKAQQEFQLKMEEMNKKQGIDIANLQNEVKKIGMDFQVEVMKIQSAAQTAEMTAKVQLQTSLQAASQAQAEPVEAPEAPKPSAPPIVINNIIPAQASKKKVTLSGPLENRVGVVEDIAEAPELGEE